MAKLTPKQFKEITRYRYGLRAVRPDGPRLGPVNGPYAYVYKRWHAFDQWNSWKDRGGPRPEGVWKAVPVWDGTYTPWMLRAELLKKRAPVPTHPVDPVPPHPPAFSLAPAQSWLILAEDISDALEAPSYYGRAYVADRAYEQPSPAMIAHYKSLGVRQAVWCDCRADGTPAEYGREYADSLGLPFIGQGETAAECAAALMVGARIIVGQLAGVSADKHTYDVLCAAILSGHVLWIEELYKNCMPGQLPDWRNLPVAGSLVAAYRDAQCESQPWADGSVLPYADVGLFVPHRDSVYGAGLSPDAYRELP